ncbi:MAG: type III pantothenate kinase, partial [Steroidobacteraceae bacterium]
MVVLLVDIGNSRIKWARTNGGRFGPRHAAAHLGWGAGEYQRRLFGKARGRGARAPEMVLVSSVAAPKVNRRLAAAARLAGARTRFAKV